MLFNFRYRRLFSHFVGTSVCFNYWTEGNNSTTLIRLCPALWTFVVGTVESPLDNANS